MFLEIGPDGTLSALGGEGTDSGAVFIPLLRPGQPAAAQVTAALARAHVHGAGVHWAAVLGSGQRVDLPTYAFQHQRYWPRPAGLARPGGDGAGAAAGPILGAVERGDLQALAETWPCRTAGGWARCCPALARLAAAGMAAVGPEAGGRRVTWAPGRADGRLAGPRVAQAVRAGGRRRRVGPGDGLEADPHELTGA